MSELSQAIEEMRTMRESYDSLAAASSAYNEGRAELAANLRAKGIEASESEGLPALAEKVTQIQTQEITIDGGEMYPANIWGSSLHDLFAVAKDVRNNGQYDSYSGFIVAQFYKGYETFDLSTIAADAYLTSDGDFYTSMQSHTWHDDDSNYADRYIVFFFTNDNYNFRSIVSGVCPRQIIVVGNCASIYINYNRLTQLYVFTEIGASLGGLSFGTNTPQGAWSAVQVLRGYNIHSEGSIYINVGSSLISVNMEDLYELSGGQIFLKNNTNTFDGVNSISFPKLRRITGGYVVVSNSASGSPNSLPNCSEINLPMLEEISGGGIFQNALTAGTTASVAFSNVQKLIFPSLGRLTGGTLFDCKLQLNVLRNLRVLSFPSLITWSGGSIVGAINFDYYKGSVEVDKIILSAIEQLTTTSPSYFRRVDYIYIGYTSNDRSKSVTLRMSFGVTSPADIELKDGYRKPLNISAAGNLTAENIALHILDRLGDNTDGATLTITIGSANLNRINADETYAPYVAAAVAKNYIIN